jgi:hypothetical protein
VRCEIPQDVYVRLNQPEVDPDRVDELDIADPSSPDDLPELPHGRRIAVGVITHQGKVRLAGQRDQLARLGRGGGQRLLHKDVLACPEGRAHQLEVCGRWCGDRDRCDLLVVEHFLVGRRRLHCRLVAEDGTGTLQVQVAQPLQAESWRGQRRPDEVRPPVPRADDG